MINKEQKDKVKKSLLQLGFSVKEIEIYLSILQTSDASILSMARETGLSRGTIYDIIENLKHKSFITEIRKGKKRRFIPENATNRFYSQLDQEHEIFENHKKLVEEILPIIKGINVSEEYKPKIRIYTGEQGFKKVWDEILNNPEKSYLSIAKIETFAEFAGTDYLTELQNKKVKLSIASRNINQDSPLARKLKKTDSKYNRETKLLTGDLDFPSTEIIYNDKIAMFSTRKENIILVIESKDFAQTHKVYFEIMWQFLENKF